MIKFICTLILFTFIGCSHNISRIGYVPDVYPNPCQPIFKYAKNLGNIPVTKIGSIRLGDTGFSINCSKEDAVRILTQEACSIDADIIVIVDEAFPGIISSCYRVDADFVKLTDRKMKATLQSDNLN